VTAGVLSQPTAILRMTSSPRKSPRALLSHRFVRTTSL